MVKFAKQLEAQLVQEWRSAYVDYKRLKRDIKALKEEKATAALVPENWQSDGHAMTPATPLISAPSNVSATTKRQMTMTRRFSRQVTGGVTRMQDTVTGTFNSFVSATGRAADVLRSKPISQKLRTNPDVIKVEEIEATAVGQHEVYRTKLINAFGSLEAPSRIFFARLDTEFNKVNHYYRSKEEEFIEHYERLKKQVEALEEIRLILKNGPHVRNAESQSEAETNRPKTIAEAIQVATQFQASRVSGAKSLPFIDVGRRVGKEFVAVPIEDRGNSLSSRNAASTKTEHSDSREPKIPSATVEMAVLGSTQENGDNSSGRGGRSSDGGDSNKPRMRLRIPLTTPGNTIKTLTHSLWEDLQRQGGHGLSRDGSSNGEEVHFAVTKHNLTVAEKMLQTAFVEFYRGLTLLKSYSSLNMVAFAKIVKKFDKVAGFRTFPIYIKTVESCYFNTSDKATILLEKVESLFAGAFFMNDRSKARLRLRPPQKKSSHVVTFFLGLFTGGTLAFLAVFAVLLDRMLDSYIAPFHRDNSLAPSPALQQPENIYLKTVFPLFGLSALIILHMFMYGFNVYYWRKWRINYAFMFDFKQGTELRQREVLMIASILMAILVAAMVGHLALHSVSDSPYVDFVPLSVFMLLVVLLFFPLNMFYRSSRSFLITAFIHLAMAPMYKVILQDFFLGDQLTSQVPMLRNLQYLVCYYAGNFFRTSNADGCLMNETYKGLVYMVSLLPYWWRFLQCMRRYFEEHDGRQLLNAGKYMSAMVAVSLGIQYLRNRNFIWFFLFVVAAIFATVFQTYWDLWVDWGLMQKNSKNKWLRDNLIMPKAKYWYFLSMVANVILRLAWLQSVTRFRFGLMDFQVADFTFAALEVIRRGIWNFYRMENEHLNNVGKYRATKTVPLPFENPIED